MLPSIPIPPAQGKSSLAPYKQNMKKSWTSNSRWAQEAEGRVDHKYAFPHTCCRGPRPHIRGSPSRIKNIATGKHHLLLHNRPSLISRPLLQQHAFKNLTNASAAGQGFVCSRVPRAFHCPGRMVECRHRCS